MHRKILRSILLGFAIVLAVVATTAGYFSYTRFFRYQSHVDRFLETIPQADRGISPEARDVFEKLDGNAMPWIATKCLLNELAPARVTNREWHIRGLIWEKFLPTRLSRDEMIAVYTHCMFFGDGSGISFGAKKLYGKAPSELTTAEAIGLVAVFRQPGNSPDRNPQGFREQVERLTQRYRAAG